jgi:probable selenium-dependent hydroxylase accessory protein YqeC
MKLCNALDLRPGEAVAFVGAGGKTTAIWQVQAELATTGVRSIVTTTTKMMEPVLPRDGVLLLTPRPDATRIADLLNRAPRLVLASRRLGGLQPIHSDHPVPSRPFKLDGLAPDVLGELSAQLPGITWLIEADGAKGAGLKISADHEPVIPVHVTTVVVMAHLDTLGQPLDETTVHRVGDATRILGVPVGTPLMPAMFARVLTDESVGLKGVPNQARAVAMLTQRGTTLHPEAHSLADQLVRGRYERVVIAALRADDPVLAIKEFDPHPSLFPTGEKAGMRGSQTNVAAIILAAGASERFGQPKLLLDWHGKPLIAHVADVVLASPVRPVVVVLGAHEEAIRNALGSRPVQIVFNPSWRDGMSTSVRAGLAALPSEASGALFVLADQPNVTPELLTWLITRFQETGAPIIEPRAGSRPGNPTLFAREMFGELAQVTGDHGGRPLINKYADRVAVVHVNDLSTLQDIDTFEDYKYQMSNFTSQNGIESLAKMKAVVSDMDGVLWRGNEPMPGLKEFFAFLREHDIRFILATNNATRTAAQYAAKLAEFGVQVSEAEILPSCDVVSDYLATVAPKGARVFVVGEAALVNSLTARGFVVSEGEAEFVVAGLDRKATYAKLARATRFIRQGARFIGTNPDRTWPAENEITPGAGAVLAFLEAATDVKPFIVAKPEPVMFDQALARMGSRLKETVMIGDRLETDILGGQRAGLETILVLSGISTEADIEKQGIRPDWIFGDIGELTQVWQETLAKVANLRKGAEG